MELSENLIVTYSPKRAAKDKADRDRLIQKASDMLEHSETINASQKRGGRKYIAKTSPNKETYVLNQEKILLDEIYDGYYAIQTSEKDMDEKQVIDAHHNLWKIEESFRAMKSLLEIRPLFHWTEKRIRGHFVVAFIAFVLERELEYCLQSAGIMASPKLIKEAINNMQFSQIQINEKNE